MLGRERAAVGLHRVIDHAVDGRLMRGQKGRGFVAIGALHVVVQIAVAQVAEIDQAHPRKRGLQRRVGGCAEGRDGRDGQGDVVLDVQAFLALGQRDGLAQMPQRGRLGQAAGQAGIGYQALLKRGLQQGLAAAAGGGFVVGGRLLQQHGPGRGGQGLRQLRKVAPHQVQRKLVHHLKAGQAGAQAGLRQAQQGQALRQRLASGQGRDLGRRHREQLERGGGDDAQRAFAADEQIAQVVAGVVLAQATQALPDLALGRHHLQAQAQLAGIAVAQHRRAAGIGGQVAADGATALGRQAERE